MVKAAHKIILGDYLVLSKPWSYFFRSLLGFPGPYNYVFSGLQGSLLVGNRCFPFGCLAVAGNNNLFLDIDGAATSTPTSGSFIYSTTTSPFLLFSPTLG